mmetsp:Transcript_15590/g.48251  ORF Transcript_15590/g.48251 Transcript_15590/m.48251 type:complete len:331 (+) Transcript_15590:496-1488(+)
MMKLRRALAVAARSASVGALSWSSVGTGPKISGAATATAADGRVLMWGGLNENKEAVDTLWAYDGAWTAVATSGSAPAKAMYAAAAVQPFNSREEFVVCGGWDPGAKGSGGTFSDAVHALDLKTLEWMSDDPLPCGAVSRHGAAAVDGRIFVHTFRDGVVRRDACGIAKSHLTTGDAPEGVSMCAVAPLADPAPALLVFGGSTKTQGFSADAYVLDAASYEWRRLDAPGGPGPRGSCCAAAVDGSRVVVFGGAGVAASGYDGGKGLRASDETWLLTVDGDRGTWELLDVAGPPPRVAASLELLPDASLLLAGGWDPATGATFDDCWTLTL